MGSGHSKEQKDELHKAESEYMKKNVNLKGGRKSWRVSDHWSDAWDQHNKNEKEWNEKHSEKYGESRSPGFFSWFSSFSKKEDASSPTQKGIIDPDVSWSVEIQDRKEAQA